MSDNEPKIRQLPGRRVTPETLLAMALEDCRDTKIAVVVTLNGDDLCDIVHSRASIAELTYMAGRRFEPVPGSHRINGLSLFSTHLPNTIRISSRLDPNIQ